MTIAFFGVHGPWLRGRLRPADDYRARRRPRVNSARMTLSSEEVERYARQIVLRGRRRPGAEQAEGRASRSSSAPEAWARPRCNIWPAQGSEPSASSTTTSWRSPTCIARSSMGPATSGGRRRKRRRGDPADQSACRSRTASRRGSTPQNARALVARFDVVLDGSDNFATRYALSDACYHERRPLVVRRARRIRRHADDAQAL